MQHRFVRGVNVLKPSGALALLSTALSPACGGDDTPSTDAVDLALGERHSCALFADGHVTCWGTDQNGQLGNGDELWGQRDLPSTVTHLKDAEQIAAGDGHTCARLKNGSVSCWGQNDAGQLGTDSTVDEISPAAVVGLDEPALFLAAGGTTTCSVLRNGAIQCWGDNALGQAGGGDGSPDNYATPTAVSGLSGPAISVAVGATHSCALLESGEVECWGSNEEGGLAGGDDLEHEGKHSPTVVVGLAERATDVGAMLDGTCVIAEGGTAYCAGYGFDGGEFNDGTELAEITGVPESLRGLSMSHDVMCAVEGTSEDSGEVFCWELERGGGLTVGALAGSPNDVRRVELGAEHGCLIDGAGKIYCWGSDSYGQLGNGSDGSTQEEAVAIGETSDEPAKEVERGEDALQGTAWAFNEFSDEYTFDQAAPSLESVLDPRYATSELYEFESETFDLGYFIGPTNADGLTELTLAYAGANAPVYLVFKIEPHPSGSGRCLFLSARESSPEERPTTVDDRCHQEL